MENSPPNQHDLDQQRNNSTVVGDSTSMTIEFLRARLLAERSVSRTARQRADELAKRVVELEEQLKVVSLQRKKAEKATADVLAILEKQGVSDFSEEFDSSSDQESHHYETKLEHNFQEEKSAGSNLERNQTDDFSGSEIETSSLTGRSLSWKSGKDSPSSGGKNLVVSSSKNQSPFSSPSFASPRRSTGGKSCRRIRQREPRSTAEEHTNGSTPQENGDADCAEGCPTSSGSSTQIPGSGSENRSLNIVVKGLGDLEGRQSEALLSNHLHNRNGEMERALEDQTQLIGQYEEEEKAQREWEDKFRESNSSPVSCERGTTQSDITEEIDETKPDSAPYHVPNNGSTDFEIASNVEIVSIVEQSSSTSKLSCHQSPPPISLYKGDTTLGSKNENDSMPREGTDKLGSVLEALQQAKLSLNHKLKASPPLNDGTIRKAIEFSPKDRPEVPIGCGGIFKVPSDFYIENTTQNNTLMASNPRLSLANYYPIEQTALNSENTWPRTPAHLNNLTYNGLNISEGVRARLDTDVPFPSPYVYNSRSMEMNNVGSSYASPTYPLYNDPLLRMPYGGERPSSSINMNQVRSSYASLTYPLYTDPMLRMSSGGEQVFSSSGSGVGRGDLSFYNHPRPNMYR